MLKKIFTYYNARYPLIVRGTWFAILSMLILHTSTFAQVYPVQANLVITPPYSVYLSDYTTPGSMRLSTNLYLADLSKPSIDVRFRIHIEGVGVELKTKPAYLGTRVTIPSGIPTQFYGDQLTEYFALENLDIVGLSRTQLESTGALPEGIYRFTIEVLAYDRGVQISNSANSTAWLILNDPPLINLPANEELIMTLDPQIVRFQWTPRHKGSPNSSFSTEYLLKIVEIWPANRNPNDAINTSNPIFETTTTNNYFVYSVADPPLIPGRKYAFQVQAKATSGIDQLDLFKNDGFSEVRLFQFGNHCGLPEEIEVVKIKNRSIELKWSPPDGATAFTVEYRENSTNANSFEKLTYIPTGRLDMLKQGMEYEIQIKSHCATLFSEFSNPILLSTTNIESDFTCENLEFTYDLGNHAPIDFLRPGEVITAGDFEVELVYLEKRGSKYSGYGIAKIPFLNMLKTNVIFENLSINSDYRVFDGVLTTIYDANSSMMFDLDKPEPQVELIPDDPVSATPVTTDSLESDNSSSEITLVDTLFVNDQGEIIALIDNKEVVLNDSTLATQQFVDPMGNNYALNDNGELEVSNAQAPITNETVAASTGMTNLSDLEFGPLKIFIEEEKEPETNDDQCIYNELKVSIELILEDYGKSISKEISLKSAYLSYTKNCETGEIISGRLTWSSRDNAQPISFYDFQADAYNLDLTIDKEGISIGNIEFDAYLEEDKALTNLIILKKGISGGFRYAFHREEGSLAGQFDFRGIENINIELVKQEKVLAQLSNVKFSSEGTITGRTQLLSEIQYISSGFEVIVKKANFEITYVIGQEVEINEGSAILVLSSIRWLEGELKLQVNILENATTAEVQANELVAFGMILSDFNLKIDMDKALNFTSISGNLMAAHPSFGAEIEVSKLLIEHGQLMEFNTSGRVVYDELEVKINNGELDQLNSKLVLDAFVELDKEGISFTAEVYDFTISIDGEISWGGFNANFNGVKTFGPLTVAISGESSSEQGNWQETTAEASLELALENVDEPLSITGAKISYKKHKRRDQYQEIKISLNEANLNVDFGVLRTQLQSINIELETSDNYIEGDGSNASNVTIVSGSNVNFSVALEEDLELAELMFVKEGVTGAIGYTFSGDGLTGRLDYSDVKNLNIIARKGETVFAGLTNASISEQGLLSGQLSVLPNNRFQSKGFSIEVITLNYQIELPLNGSASDFVLHGGNGNLKITGVGAVEGSLEIDFELDPEGNLTSQVNSSTSIKAFNMELSEFDLKVELTRNLDLNLISGHLTAKHEGFDSELRVSEFILEEGSLKTFNLQGQVKYEGFDLKLDKAEYENGVLEVDGKLAISITDSEAWLAVEKLIISEDGKVEIKGINGELDKSPVLISFSASMEESKFAGSFTGELSGVGLSGTIDIGVANNAYNFAYLELSARGNVPMPGTGLKLTELGGQFGYNYALIYHNLGDKPEGSPQEGNYVVGLLIGVADMANVVEVTGNSVVQFGNGKFDLNLNGSLNVPKENSIAKGNLNAHYVMPDNTLEGTVALDVAVPASSGKLLTGNLEMNYLRGNQEWSLSSTNISAKLFTQVDFTGNINLTGSDISTGIIGELNGQADYSFQYVNDFSLFGANLKTELEAGFSFIGNITFDATGAEGLVNLSLYANGQLGIETEVGEYERLIELSGYTMAELRFNRTEATVRGAMDITVYILGLEQDVEVEIDQSI